MSKFIKLSAVSLVSFGLALSVFGQDVSPTTTVNPTRTPHREEIKKEREEMKEMREEKKEEMNEMREAHKQEMEQKREDFKQDMERKREELKRRLEQKREELKNRTELKHQELKKHLIKIKDERKKQAVERINKSLDALNERMTNHFLKVLDKLEDVLARVNERTDVAEDKGIDVSSVDAAIAAAQEAIRIARAAIEAQAAKTYTITVNTEDKLKSDVGKTRQALHADLKVVSEAVKKAKKAVHEAARAFARVHGRDLPELSPTVSPSLTVSPTITP